MNKDIILQRTRPAYEKLFIGWGMVFSEMVSGGHYLEVLCLAKQMSVEEVAVPSYLHLHRNLVSESGLVGAFFRGFHPWGVIQCAKGAPVLFAQHESMYYLRTRRGWSCNAAEKASGFIGGFAQALFINPFQKIKVAVVGSGEMNAMGPVAAMQTVIRHQGIMSLYDGILPSMIMRSLDWGIRFGVSSGVKNWIIEQKRKNGQATEVGLTELLLCGIAGGAASGLTHPIDNIIANCMKPVPPGMRRDMVSVACRMYRQGGIQAFTHGLGINTVANAYHMAWMYGVGTVVYEWVDRMLHRSRRQ